MNSSETKNCRTEITDQKEHPDVPYAVVEYVLHPDTTYKIFLGFVRNPYDSQLRLYTTKPLKEGQVILIKSSLPHLSKKATVCWVEKYDSFYYKIGLEFTQ